MKNHCKVTNFFNTTQIILSAKNGLKGQYANSPGHRPGLIVTKSVRPERAKALIFRAFALSGRLSPLIFTQGDALGYVVIGLSGRSSKPHIC